MPRGSRPRTAIAALAAIALLTGITSGPAAAAVAPDAWGGALGGSGNSSFNPGERVLVGADAGRAARAWTAAAEFSSIASGPPVVRSGVAYWVGGDRLLIATSVRTGATVWTRLLPNGKSYTSGTAISGSRLVLTYSGSSKPGGGLLAFDVTKRKTLWQRALPAERGDRTGDTRAGRPSIDAGRVFVTGSSNAVNAYRLSDGRPLWRVPFRSASNGSLVRVDGIAALSGTVVTSGQGGLQAYRGKDGRRLWRSAEATSGLPVIAAGRVFVTDGATSAAVQAFALSGCGRTSCAPMWATASYPVRTSGPVIVSTAGPASVFITFTSDDNPPDACDNRRQGHLQRLSAATGALQWGTTTGIFIGRPVRGGDTVWAYSEQVTSTCEVVARILAFTTAGAGTAPIAELDPAPRQGFQDGLAVAGGTLLQQDRIDPLIGYRAPGT